jgi:hypothetical protein
VKESTTPSSVTAPLPSSPTAGSPSRWWLRLTSCSPYPRGNVGRDGGGSFRSPTEPVITPWSTGPGLGQGESLLVLGAAGGVGLAAVQIGAALGARVIAAVSSNEKKRVVTEAGASEVDTLRPRSAAGRVETDRSRRRRRRLRPGGGRLHRDRLPLDRLEGSPSRDRFRGRVDPFVARQPGPPQGLESGGGLLGSLRGNRAGGEPRKHGDPHRVVEGTAASTR